jgi:inorganic triphosphatase YgiF
MMDTIERELKLMPASEALLDHLAVIDRLGPFVVRGRRHERQHNAFFDSAAGGLRQVQVGFRRRAIDGQQLATWTIKGDKQHVGGIASRAEIELQLDPQLAPGLALGALRDAARTRGAVALAEEVDDALAIGGLPLPRPFLETVTDRGIVDLEAPAEGWQIELALDRVELVGHDYNELEIEAELKRGDEAALEAAHTAIAAQGEVTESKGSKLSRAAAHLEDCDCVTNR